MGTKSDDDIDMSDVKIDVDDNTVEEVPSASKSESRASESEAATPLEDRFGRPLWAPTRICHCPNDAATDCRFHSPEKEGWEVCPYADPAKAKRTEGRWLWARNPLYGKPLTEDEVSLASTKVE
jgi:hypothetical protein